jgi:hypothetical protein
VGSENHEFVGRVLDLGIVQLSFDTYEQLAQFPDCKYAVDTGCGVQNLVRRVESLNLVGRMLWPEPMPKSFSEMPVSQYEWLTIATDLFLVRYASVIDCALILTNQVFQFGLSPRECRIEKIVKADLPAELVNHFQAMLDEQEQIRSDRNARIHHGYERPLTDDDTTFKTASFLSDKLGGVVGSDVYGRKIDVDLSFREGLVGLQREFNLHVRRLERQLDRLYDLLWREFEERFGPLIASATHRLNASSKVKRSS